MTQIPDPGQNINKTRLNLFYSFSAFKHKQNLVSCLFVHLFVQPKSINNSVLSLKSLTETTRAAHCVCIANAKRLGPDLLFRNFRDSQTL